MPSPVLLREVIKRVSWVGTGPLLPLLQGEGEVVADLLRAQVDDIFMDL